MHMGLLLAFHFDCNVWCY